MTQPQTREQLLQRRDELTRRLDAIHADFRRGLSADSQERAAELENAETLAEIERVAALDLAEVNRQLAALDR